MSIFFFSLAPTPSRVSALRRELLEKPRHPTSTGQSTAFQPFRSASSRSSEYFLAFLSCALCIPASSGTVSSIRSTLLVDGDQITMSGRKLVTAMEGGKTSFSFRSIKRFQSFAPSRLVLFLAVVLLPCFPSPFLTK